jgi:purine-binding chemotaxis protein CheW
MPNGEAPQAGLQDGSESNSSGAVVPAADASVASSMSDDSSITQVTEEDKKKILKERALKLAQKADEDRAAGESLDVIEFMLAHERYAIEVQFVREVYPLQDLTPVPCTPSFILGILNVRGKVISVTDVREFFDLPKKEITDMFRVLIVDNHSMELGVLADEIVGESKIPLTEIHSGMVNMGKLRADFVRGVTQDRLIVLDADKLLSDKTIVVHQEVGE